MQLGIAVGKNWALSADRYWLQALQVSGHLIGLLSILLRCKGFAGIQKAIVDQTGSRPPDSDRDFFLLQVWLWEVLWSFLSVQPLSWSSPAVLKNPLFIIHHNPVSKWFVAVMKNKRTALQTSDFSGQLTRHPLIEVFHLPNLFKCQMTIEWSVLSSLVASRVAVRGSSKLIGRYQLPMAHHHVPHFKALVSFVKLLEPPLRCMCVSSSNAKCIVDVVSCLQCFMTHFEFE